MALWRIKSVDSATGKGTIEAPSKGLYEASDIGDQVIVQDGTRTSQFIILSKPEFPVAIAVANRPEVSPVAQAVAQQAPPQQIIQKTDYGMWGGLVLALGNAVGGAVEAGGAASDPKNNEHAARSVQAGRSIRSIFSPGSDVSQASQNPFAK